MCASTPWSLQGKGVFSHRQPLKQTPHHRLLFCECVLVDGIPCSGVCVCVYACSTQVLLRPIVKEVFMVRAVRDIVPMLRKAFQVAMSGVPGPVFVELPIDTLYVGCPTTTNTQL